MNQLAIDISAARAAGQRGMRLAIERAEHLDDTFPARAEAFIYEYARTHGQFISEALTAAAEAAGVAPLSDPRAWGAPFKRAAAAGVIRRIGFGTSLRRHCAATPLWASLVYGGEVA